MLWTQSKMWNMKELSLDQLKTCQVGLSVLAQGSTPGQSGALAAHSTSVVHGGILPSVRPCEMPGSFGKDRPVVL